jgi:hypothetical protein
LRQSHFDINLTSIPRSHRFHTTSSALTAPLNHPSAHPHGPKLQGTQRSGCLNGQVKSGRGTHARDSCSTRIRPGDSAVCELAKERGRFSYLVQVGPGGRAHINVETRTRMPALIVLEISHGSFSPIKIPQHSLRSGMGRLNMSEALIGSEPVKLVFHP